MNSTGSHIFFCRKELKAPFLVGLAIILSAAGCWEEPEPETRKIITRSEGSFAGKPGEAVGPLEVQILGPAIRGILGRRGFRDPVEGTSVQFEVTPSKLFPDIPLPVLLREDPAKKIPPSEESKPGESIHIDTDSGGYARAWVLLPKAIGEWRVQAVVKDQYETKIDVEFRITSGVKIYETNRERTVGKKVQVAVQLFKVDASGNVVPDAEKDTRVWFQIDGFQHNAQLGKGRIADRIKTNQDGVATADLFLGDQSGIYQVLASPISETGSEKVQLSPVVLRGIAVDWTKVAAEILGGALLFLVGLRILAAGLMNLIGPGLALPVTAFSRSRLNGFLGGLAAGTMFQSSAGVTSRLISFSNGGLLAASGALAIILGASLGRTILPQVLAFPIGTASIAFLALGMLGLFLPRRLSAYAWGWLFLGIGLVILGSWLFALGLDIAKISPMFREYLAEWDFSAQSAGNKIWTFTTVMASAAALGFIVRNGNLLVVGALLMGNAGLISAGTALPIVIGANLGPGVSLFLASLRRRREARRIAILQLLVQIVGAFWLAALSLTTVSGIPIMLYLTEWITPGILFHSIPEHVGHHIAMVHTLFNFLNLLICLALGGFLLRLTERIIPRDPVQDDIKPFHLDPNLIEVPALAILQATHEVTYLTELSRKAIAESFDAFRYSDLKLAEQTSRREESISSVHRDISQYLLRVGENDLSHRESSRLQILQATTGNLVRIGELGERLRELTARAIEEKADLPEDVARDLNEIYELVMGQFENVLQLLERPDGRTEENAVKLTERLAKFGSRVERAWFEKLRRQQRNGAGERSEQPASSEQAAGLTVQESKEIGQGASPPIAYLHMLIYHDALETLFQVAGHLSHAAERARVLSPKS